MVQFSFRKCYALFYFFFFFWKKVCVLLRQTQNANGNKFFSWRQKTSRLTKHMYIKTTTMHVHKWIQSFFSTMFAMSRYSTHSKSRKMQWFVFAVRFFSIFTIFDAFFCSAFNQISLFFGCTQSGFLAFTTISVLSFNYAHQNRKKQVPFIQSVDNFSLFNNFWSRTLAWMPKQLGNIFRLAKNAITGL